MRVGLFFGAALLGGGLTFMLQVFAAEPVTAPPLKTYPLAAESLILSAAPAGNAVVAVADRGFILRSTDNGATWVQQASPVTVMLTAVHMIDAATGWAVGHDATILNTTDGGVTWTKKFEDIGLETPLFDIWFENERHGIAVGAYGLIQETADGGATWTERRISADELHLYAIVAGKDGALFAVGEAGAIFRSPDRGITWKALDSPYTGTFFGALALKDGGLLIYGLRGNLFRSDDSGATWTALQTGTEASLQGGTQRADGSVVVVGLSGTVLTSPDGKTFTHTTLADREALADAVETPSGKLLVVGEKGAQALEAAR